MAFPPAERVVYERNTLELVKCEVRFPPILAIEASTPTDFQEAVRAAFPDFEMKTSVKLPPGVPPAIANVIKQDLSRVGNKSYAFISEDRSQTLSLSKDGLSLTSRRYERWEPFRGCLVQALDALAQIYRPSFFRHTCVRYKNSIRRRPLDLDGTPWSALLQPWISGLLAKVEMAEAVEAYQSRSLIRLDDNTRVDANLSLAMHQPSKEPAFIIEAHVYNEARKALNDVIPSLDSLHRHAGHFFRWCVTDQLHRAMRPRPV